MVNTRSEGGALLTSGSESTEVFRRIMDTFLNPREGLSEARSMFSPARFPSIVRQLGRLPRYKSSFSPTPFPKHLRDIKIQSRLVRLPVEHELLWSASVLSLFKTEIKQFVSSKRQFDLAFPESDFNSAHAALERIKDKFGVSYWLLRYQFIVIQLAHGLKAQKALLDEIISEPRIIPSIHWMAIYFSLLADDASSVASIDSLRSLSGELAEYLRHYILPFDTAKLTDLAVPVNWDEPNSIIDRYETFISVTQRCVARFAPDVGPEIKRSLELLKGIDDPRLINLRVATQGLRLPVFSHSGLALKAADAYILGDYEKAEQLCPDQLEIKARSRVFRGLPEKPTDDNSILRENIVASMHASLIGLQNSPSMSAKLKRLAAVFCTHQYSAQILQFLSRTYAPLLKNGDYREVDRFSALNGALDNPWNLPIFAEMAADHEWVERIAKKDPPSPALRLQLVVHGGPKFSHLLPSGMPHHRRHACEGHLRMMLDDAKGATRAYAKAGEHQNGYIRVTSLGYLFNAEYKYGAYEHCLELVVDQIVTGSPLPSGLPLDGLGNRCVSDRDLKRKIDSSILICRLMQHDWEKWRRDLSNLFENILSEYGVSRASELRHVSHNISESRLIFFLKYVAIPSILEDCEVYDSYEEVGTERILICQYLLVLDELKEDEFLEEIRTITREMNISRSVQKINKSRIYVDDNEIRRICQISLREDYAKFRHLLSVPSMDDQAKRLIERFNGILNRYELSSDKFRLPASEKEALVEGMFETVAHEFSLNPAYGLDTHISTGIRHGLLRGNLMAPLSQEGILCVRANGIYCISEIMTHRITHLSAQERQVLKEIFVGFTTTLQDQIDNYEKILKVRDAEGQHAGAFHFVLDPLSRKKLCDKITLQTSLADVTHELIEECWNITERIIAQVREDLRGRFLQTMYAAFTSLFIELDAKFGRQHIFTVIDACARARTAFFPCRYTEMSASPSSRNKRMVSAAI